MTLQQIESIRQVDRAFKGRCQFSILKSLKSGILSRKFHPGWQVPLSLHSTLIIYCFLHFNVFLKVLAT